MREVLVADGRERTTAPGLSSDLLRRRAATADGMPARGDRVGGYRVRGRLGGGGMGQVFAAHDAGTGRELAVKLLHPWLRDEARLANRLRLEAAATLRVRHAGVIRIVDVGRDERWGDYLVMELLEGISVAERAGGSPIPWTEAIEVGRQVAASMSAAHAAGVIHRDLKPENVFLTRGRCEPFRVKVLDFGLARVAAEPDVLEDSAQTWTIGTPLYMAPEQWRGVMPADERTDIYALGCMLYELIAGRPPFVGSELAVQDGHLNRLPPPLGFLCPGVPDHVARYIAMMMAKRSADRPWSMRDVQDALSLCVAAGGTCPDMCITTLRCAS